MVLECRIPLYKYMRIITITLVTNLRTQFLPGKTVSMYQVIIK